LRDLTRWRHCLFAVELLSSVELLRLMFRSSLIIALVSLAVLSVHAAAMAYVTVGGEWPQPGGPGTPVEITYSYQNMFDGSLRGPGAVPGPNGMFLPNGEPLPAALIRASIEEALGLWASVAPLVFIEVEDDGLFYYEGSTQYGDIRFRHVHINGTDPPPPGDPIAKAQAWYPFGGQLSGDVEFDDGDPWQEVGTRPIPDILGATIHELGHALGLGHTGLSTANMYWIFTRYGGLGTGRLHSDDIAGIRSIYGSGQGRVIPLSIRIPEPTGWMLGLITASSAWFVCAGRFRRQIRREV
jgi:hypothetical protein